MIPAIWPVSVFLEAALATRMGGFSAFRRFLCVDVIIQCGALGFADSPWYPQYEAVTTAIGLLALAPAVWEARVVARSATTARLLAISAFAAIIAYLLLAKPGYSLQSSAAWASASLFHSMFAVFLFAGMQVSGTNRHPMILALWLFGDAALLYLAPVFAVGYAVLWLNAMAWGARLCAGGIPSPLQPDAAVSAISLQAPQEQAPAGRAHRYLKAILRPKPNR